jgi:hypothetical protein
MHLISFGRFEGCTRELREGAAFAFAERGRG